MAKIIFEDYTIQVQKAMDSKINAVLEECAGELESQVKRNTRVDTSNTKNKWDHRVDDARHTAYIGNPLENAIWEEFGKNTCAELKSGKIGIVVLMGIWYNIPTK